MEDGQMIYLTFSNGMSGVYRSQVLDVCDYLRGEFDVCVRVVALVSIRRFRSERRAFGEAGSPALVLPMVPGVRNWRLNALVVGLLALIWRERAAIGRSEFATGICLILRRWGILRRVGFDGRSARAAEAREYELGGRLVFADHEIEALERSCVLGADVRIAVSSRLLDYWRRSLGYEGQRHVTIPSTVVESPPIDDAQVEELRREIRFETDDVVLGYAGSTAQWQSLARVDGLLCEALERQNRLRALLLTNLPANSLQAARKYPERVVVRWVAPQEVGRYLQLLDYGLLIREASVTNRVASPTKFGEYLQAGARVLISPDIGDLSDFVARHGCGRVVADGCLGEELPKVEPAERRRCRELAEEHFTKRANRASYATLLRALGEPVK